MKMLAYGARDIYLGELNINRPLLNKTFEWDIKYVKKLDIEDILCPVTMNEIKDKYIKCKTCSKIFYLEVKEYWINEKHNCPYCRQKWNNNVIYHIKK
jgi:uncharacterized CHY-type Zn-finger protein